jgi:hypothetical protein
MKWKRVSLGMDRDLELLMDNPEGKWVSCGSMPRGSGRVQATVILVGQSRLEWPIADGQPR